MLSKRSYLLPELWAHSAELASMQADAGLVLIAQGFWQPLLIPPSLGAWLSLSSCWCFSGSIMFLLCPPLPHLLGLLLALLELLIAGSPNLCCL